MDLSQGAAKRSANRIVQAYRDLNRVMADQSSTLEDLQGAVEYLLDVVKSAQQNPLSD